MNNDTANTVIYHACQASAWQAAVAAGVYEGSETDKQDGFIHFSDGKQIRDSVARYHAGKSDLVLLTVETAQLGPDLKWEASRNNNLYPHLYNNLSVQQVTSVDPLPLDGDGKHIFPPGFPTV
jgi:uncharacterized protein (DUF952 family)